MRNSSLLTIGLAPALTWTLLASGAFAKPFILTIDPAIPTWQDKVGFTVEGLGCNASLDAPVFVSGGIRVDLHDACAPGVAHPYFSIAGQLPLLPPGTFELTVADGEGSVKTSVPIHDVGTIGLEPETLASSTDARPVHLVVFGTCLSWEGYGSWKYVPITIGFCPFEAPPDHVRVFSPDVGPLPPGAYAVTVFDDRTLVGGLPSVVGGDLHVRDATRCFPADDRLCLHDGRFAVTGHWRAFDGSTGPMHATPLAGSDEAGTLWFFAPDNTELTVKVLDGCAPSRHWWAFVSSASTVEYEVVVTDITTGHAKTYRNELGHTPSLLADTAYEVCP